MPLFVDHAGLNTLIDQQLNTQENILGEPSPRPPVVTVTNQLNRSVVRSANGVAIGEGVHKLSLGGTWPTERPRTYSFWINFSGTLFSGGTPKAFIFKKGSNKTERLHYDVDQSRWEYRVDSNSDYKQWHFSTSAKTNYENKWNHIHLSWDGNFGNNPTFFTGSTPHSVVSSIGGATGTDTISVPDSFHIFDSSSATSPNVNIHIQNFAYWKTSGLTNSILYNAGIPLTGGFPNSENLFVYYPLGNESALSLLSPGNSIGTGIKLINTSGTANLELSFTNGFVLGTGTGSATTSTSVLGYVGKVSAGNQLAALNTHRNGPYGYSTWKQLRTSRNPITRNHIANSTMTFVTQPGPVRNIDSTGELRVRDRYSSLYTFTEPPIAQKSYPLIVNTGKHFKDSNGNVDLDNPEKFSIVTSYANQGIGFANDKVDKLHNFDPDEEKTEYRKIYNLYADGGLNDLSSPLTYWEFLQYRETVFPHMKNQFQNENLERPNFTSFYRHKRQNRTKLIRTSSFGYDGRSTFGSTLTNSLSQSSWPMDEHQHFLTRSYNDDEDSVNFTAFSAETVFPIGLYGRQASIARSGEGTLMNTLTQYHDHLNGFTAQLNSSNLNNVKTAVGIGGGGLDSLLSPSPLYMRRISLPNVDSTSNPSGMLNTHSGSLSSNKLFQGGALWEAGSTRQVKNNASINRTMFDSSLPIGTYVSAPKKPFYDTYEGYIEEARRRYKNFSVVSEFRMSTQVADYMADPSSIELDMFEVTGGTNDAQNSSQSKFYEIYSNSDFMRQFELLNEDHKNMSNGKVLSLRCKAVKKFLPYEGFYPAQRAVSLAKQFYDSYKNNIKLENTNSVELNNFNFGRQMVMCPLFAPGVLFNTIKSGIAVDYPIITGSLSGSTATNKFLLNNDFDKRIPFEALLEPEDYLSNYKLTCNEPHPSGNLSASALWDGQGDGLYSMMANNFLAESINFFLPGGQLTSIASKRQKDITLVSGSIYGMRVKMGRSMNGTRGSIYHYGTASLPYMPPQDVSSLTGADQLRETFTMYSRPSAFGPPTRGQNKLIKNTTSALASNATLLNFQMPDRFDTNISTGGGNTTLSLTLDSRRGYNFPFTPPYYHGEAWCHITFTASNSSMTIKQIQEASRYEYLRYDNSFISVTSSSPNKLYGISDFVSTGPQGLKNINKNAVQLSSSLNMKGVGTILALSTPEDLESAGEDDSLIVDSGAEINNRWIIQTKFETPMLNFNHISEAGGTLSVPTYGSESVPRGMWHQYGRIPEENEGVFLQIGAIPENYQKQVMSKATLLEDMSEVLGFSGINTKLGRIRTSKTIYEAVVAVPFIEENGDKKFFKIDLDMVKNYKAGGAQRLQLTQGDPQSQIGRSVLDQLQKMEKYIFPPSFDFMTGDEEFIDPIAMYIFEFSHSLSQQDLSDIWQNLPPDIGTTMEESELAITHPLLKKELLGDGGGQSGNTLIDMPNKLKWMVFKVKQRAASNYFKKTTVKNPEIGMGSAGSIPQETSVVDEFGKRMRIQYNWPYDFFSLVELIKLDAEVEFGNFREEDVADYTSSMIPYDAQQADEDKIEYIVGGMEDDILADNDTPEPEEPRLIDQIGTLDTTQVFAGQSITGQQMVQESEGIFAVPPFIPSQVSRNYITAKARFSVELEKSPTLSYGQVLEILNNVISADMNIIAGYPMEGKSGTVFIAWSEWAQKWHDENSVEPLGLGGVGGGVQVSIKDQLEQSFKVEFSQEYPKVTGTKARKIRVANRRANDNVRKKYSDVSDIEKFTGLYNEYPGTPLINFPPGV